MSKKIELNVYQRHAVCAKVGTYCTLAGEHDEIEVCEWNNGEGWDISLGDRHILLTRGQLSAINALVGVL